MISPSLSLRQCPNRYAFRAGRNLPDKEFRYLRTVIVTAAVYWGFDSWLTTPLNLPAPGRRQPLYITLRFSRDLCFDKQSLGLFTAALLGVNPKEHPFSRSYGVILPSSLTRVRSLTLEFSSRLPVSVCGTGTCYLSRGFSRQCEINDSRKQFPLPITAQPNECRICLTLSLTAWTCTPTARFAYPTASPSIKTILGGTGISTCYPSPTPVGLSLGPD